MTRAVKDVDIPAEDTRVAGRWHRRGDLAWWALIAAAVLLPVARTAGLFEATYGATDADYRNGIWILKSSLVLLGVAAIVSRRFPTPGPARRIAPVTRIDATTAVILAIVLIFATCLRVYQLDTELWLDEIYLVTRYVPLEFQQLISTFDSQNHQPLYSILARISFLLAGGTDWSIRLPAVLVGVASIAALFAFGRRVSSTPEAALGAILLSVSYHHVWFSQNARGYTLMLFLAIVGTRCFLDLCEPVGRTSRLAWAYAILMALATYTHLTAALIAVGHALALVLTTRWSSADSRARALWPGAAIVLSGILTIVLYAPMLPQVWVNVTAPTMKGTDVEWTSAWWLLRESFRVLSEGVPGGFATVLVALIVLAVGVGSYWRQSRLTTLAMFLPVVVTFVAVVAARHNLWPRFFFFGAGFFVLAAIRGGFVLVRSVVRHRPDRIAVAGASMVALLSLLTVPRAWQPKQQFGAALEFVERERRPGDEVLAVDVASTAYILRGSAPTWGRLTSLDLLRDTERSATRTWIVYTLSARLRALMPDVYQHLQPPRYQPVRVFPAGVGGAEIHILRHDPSTRHD